MKQDTSTFWAGTKDRFGTAIALVGLSAALPASSLLTAAAGLATINLLSAPIRQTSHNVVRDIPLMGGGLGWATKTNARLAVAAFATATAVNAFDDDYSFNAGYCNGAECIPPAVSETYFESAKPIFRSLEGIGEVPKSMASFVFSLAGDITGVDNPLNTRNTNAVIIKGENKMNDKIDEAMASLNQ